MELPEIFDQQIAELKDATGGEVDLSNRRTAIFEATKVLLDSLEGGFELALIVQVLDQYMNDYFDRLEGLSKEEVEEIVKKMEGEAPG